MITRNLLQQPAAFALLALSACAATILRRKRRIRNPTSSLFGATTLASPMSALTRKG